MRIDYIEFKNFASYGNQKQRIEFKKEDSELFLTLGKNGHGKTTIANAIIYGLYGKVEGPGSRPLGPFAALRSAGIVASGQKHVSSPC